MKWHEDQVAGFVGEILKRGDPRVKVGYAPGQVWIVFPHEEGETNVFRLTIEHME